MMRLKTGLLVAAVIALVSVVGVVFAIDRAPEGDSATILKAVGMTCGSCAARIEQALSAEKGVESVQVDVGAGRVAVVYDSNQVKPEQLAEKVTATGYGASILTVITKEQYRSTVSGGKADEGTTGGCACCNRKNIWKEKHI